jgi:hypothetical protein
MVKKRVIPRILKAPTSKSPSLRATPATVSEYKLSYNVWFVICKPLDSFLCVLSSFRVIKIFVCGTLEKKSKIYISYLFWWELKSYRSSHKTFRNVFFISSIHTVYPIKKQSWKKYSIFEKIHSFRLGGRFQNARNFPGFLHWIMG